MPTASLQDSGFKVGLPTSINLNYSQRIKEHHYLNINWIQRIPVFENSVKRNNLVNANYMIQKEAIGFGNHQYPNIKILILEVISGLGSYSW